MHWVSMLILSIVFLVYLLIGGGIFMALEADNEEAARVDVRKFKSYWKNNFSCVDEEALEDLIVAVMKAVNSGVSPIQNATSPSNWDYSSSFFFAGTVVTTIGYGNISPSTLGGQAFCILFAFMGIPLCGIFLAAIGDKLGQRARQMEDRISKWKYSASHPKAARLIYLFVLIGLGMLLFITFPGLIIGAVEDWEYRTAWYYCFITLFTIGFGDYVMGTNEDKDYPLVYKWAGYAWIIIGLAYLALLVNMISDIMKKWGQKIKDNDDEKGGAEDNPNDETKMTMAEMDNLPIMSGESQQNGAKEKTGSTELTAVNSNDEHTQM